MFINLFCLCPLGLGIKMNYNIANVAYCTCTDAPLFLPAFLAPHPYPYPYPSSTVFSYLTVVP